VNHHSFTKLFNMYDCAGMAEQLLSGTYPRYANAVA
jgi:hypothetical protein